MILRVAIVKQALDVFGPWATVMWRDTTPMALFDIWPCKATYWETTCLLQADWYVIEQQIITDYTIDAVRSKSGREKLIRKYTSGVIPADAVPIDDYDVVITMDPILSRPSSNSCLLAYFCQEHWDGSYGRSLQRPAEGYDLFLAHMMDAADTVERLPGSVSFPYLRHPELARKTFGAEKQDAAWVDWRTITTLSGEQIWGERSDAAAKRLEAALRLPLNFSGQFAKSSYGLSDPPRWGDGADYLRQIGANRYYVSCEVAGAGQALCDAASVGCICFGETSKAYHQKICHPACLCRDMSELPERIRAVRAAPELWSDILAHQGAILKREFADGPVRLLSSALDLKRNRQSA